MSVTDWHRIKRQAGPNPDFPGRRVYLFCSLSRAEPTPDWLRRFRAEAEAEGMAAEVLGDHLYVTLPDA